jgi:hypothetical protein
MRYGEYGKTKRNIIWGSKRLKGFGHWYMLRFFYLGTARKPARIQQHSWHRYKAGSLGDGRSKISG